MVTDPPYGVEYDPAWRQRAAEQGLLAYATRRVGKVANDDRVDWREAWALFPGNVIYCWHAGRHASSVQASIESSGFEIRCQIIWAKPHFPISRGHYHWRHEPCWYAVREGANASWIGGRDQTTLWEVALDRNVEGGHGTQKPLECMARPVRNHEGDVYDPFLGSGTTLIAAEKLGRICYGMEIESRYCDVVLARWEQFTGQTAERETDHAV
jgi:DNA modification methylase